MKIFFIVLVVFIDAFYLSNSQKFNSFKSYRESKVKPENYGKKRKTNHEIKDYLSEHQLKMLNARINADDPKDLFDAKWSGYHSAANNKRKLAAYEYEYNRLILWFFLLCLVSYVLIIKNHLSIEKKLSVEVETEEIIDWKV
jgi:hypothetical protein